MWDEDDDPFRDQPYSSSDLLKPNFDPFNAHRLWLEKRGRSRKEYQALQGFAIARVKAAIEAVACGEPDPTIPLKPKRCRKRESTESERTVQQWTAAVKEIKRKKRDS